MSCLCDTNIGCNPTACDDCIVGPCGILTCKKGGYITLEAIPDRPVQNTSTGRYDSNLFLTQQGADTNSAVSSLSNIDPFNLIPPPGSLVLQNGVRLEEGNYKIVMLLAIDNLNAPIADVVVVRFVAELGGGGSPNPPEIVRTVPLSQVPITDPVDGLSKIFGAYEFMIHNPYRQTYTIKINYPGNDDTSPVPLDFSSFRPYIESRSIMFFISSMPSVMFNGPVYGVSDYYNIYNLSKLTINTDVSVDGAIGTMCQYTTGFVVEDCERMVRMEVLLDVTNLFAGGIGIIPSPEPLIVEYNGQPLINESNAVILALQGGSVQYVNGGKINMTYVGNFCIKPEDLIECESIPLTFKYDGERLPIMIQGKVILQDITNYYCCCDKRICQKFGYLNLNYNDNNFVTAGSSKTTQAGFANNRVDTNSWATHLEGLDPFNAAELIQAKQVQNSIYLEAKRWYKIIFQYTKKDTSDMSYERYILSGIKTGNVIVARFASSTKYNFNVAEIFVNAECSDFYTLTLQNDDNTIAPPDAATQSSIYPYTVLVPRSQVYVSEMPTGIQYNTIYGVSTEYQFFSVRPLKGTGCNLLQLDEIANNLTLAVGDQIRVEFVLEFDSETDANVSVLLKNPLLPPQWIYINAPNSTHNDNAFDYNVLAKSGKMTSNANFVDTVTIPSLPLEFYLSGDCVNLVGGYLLIQREYLQKPCVGGYLLGEYVSPFTITSDINPVSNPYLTVVDGTHNYYDSFLYVNTTNSCSIAVSNPDPFRYFVGGATQTERRPNSLVLKKGLYKFVSIFETNAQLTDPQVFEFILRTDGSPDKVYPFVFASSSQVSNAQEIIFNVDQDNTDVFVDLKTPISVDLQVPSLYATSGFIFSVSHIPTVFNLNPPWGVSPQYIIYKINPETAPSFLCPCFSYNLELIDQCGKLCNCGIRVEIMVKVKISNDDTASADYDTIMAKFSDVPIKSRISSPNLISIPDEITTLNFVEEITVTKYTPTFELYFFGTVPALEIIEGYIIVQGLY